MKRLSFLFSVLTVVLMGLIAVPVFGLSLAHPLVIETPTDVLQGIGATNNINTWCANGRQWIIYTNSDEDIVYRSATEENPDTWAAETLIAADTMGYGPELSIWFDDYSNTIHYARHDFMDNTTLYRMGTPGTDGTITWADVEQVVHATPSNLVTFRISMCTDIDGNPWVAWVDNDAAVDNTTGILYIESSSTDNGTWTQWAYENITTAGYHTWFARIIPLSEAPYPRVEVQYTIEKLADPNSHSVALMASDESDNFTTTYAITAIGSMNHTRPDAFSSNNIHGSSVHCVYTNDNGTLMYRARTSAQTWTAASIPTAIVNNTAQSGPWRPSLTESGSTGGFPDLMCIFSDNHGLYEISKAYAGSFGSPELIVFDASGDINRHTASYEADINAGTPLGLAYQYTDGGDDTINYWWNYEGEWGYYEGTATEEAVFDLAMILPYVFVGVALVAMVGMAMSGVVSVGGIIVLAIASVVTVVGLGVITAALNAW